MAVEAQTKDLRVLVADYVRPSTALAVGLLLFDFAVHVGFLVGAVFLEEWPLKLLCAVGAGTWAARLFVIAHDAAHGAYAEDARVCKIIAYVAFLPSLHSLSLWGIAHNRLHHREPNVQGLNSWSPISKQEYDRLPLARKLIYRLFRTPLGLGPYYAWERWWKHKFFPRAAVVGEHQFRYWADFALVFGYLLLWLLLLVGASIRGGAGSIPSVLFWGFILPYAMYSYLTGLTVYLHHTNERIPWFRSIEDFERRDQTVLTAHVQFPLWYEILSHNIMDHPVHHVNPKIPLYRLRAAQLRLNEALADSAIVEPFGIAGLLRTMRCCKLYDFELCRWTDYDGTPIPAAVRV